MTDPTYSWETANGGHGIAAIRALLAAFEGARGRPDPRETRGFERGRAGATGSQTQGFYGS